MMHVKFKQWNCELIWGNYANGRLAIKLINEELGPIATATVNIPPEFLQPDEIIIKDYAENKGMVDALVSAGVILKPHRRVKTGWEYAEVTRLAEGITPESKPDQ